MPSPSMTPAEERKAKCVSCPWCGELFIPRGVDEFCSGTCANARSQAEKRDLATDWFAVALRREIIRQSHFPHEVPTMTANDEPALEIHTTARKPFHRRCPSCNQWTPSRAKRCPSCGAANRPKTKAHQRRPADLPGPTADGPPAEAIEQLAAYYEQRGLRRAIDTLQGLIDSRRP